MSWIRYRSVPESLEILGDIARVCKSLGGPQSAALFELVEKADYQAVVDFQFDYEGAASDILYARQIHGLFSKLECLPLNVDKREVALGAFIAAEAKCKETNDRLRLGRPNGRVGTVMHMAQRKISQILGPVPNLEALNFAFGPGANTNVKSAVANPRAKLSAKLECSAELATCVAAFLEEVPAWMTLHATHDHGETVVVDVDIVPGKLVFVPKNAKTYRSISIEPLLNGFFQKGIGTYIRDRLLRSGCDLTDQTRNQRLARRASVDGTLSTLDLSMASDCLSRNLVMDLLPIDWVQFLSSLRTGKVLVDGSPVSLEKFSSMGNAFTFELESLIFYGLSYAAVRESEADLRDVSVYGDDLIVPVDATRLLIEVLDYAGFSVNSQKSYAQGPFRESCGADYLNGLDIRPFYQKTPVSERTLFTMHNWFVRHCENELAAAVRDRLCPTMLLFGPDGYGDGHLIGDHSLRQSRTIKRCGWGGGYFDTYVLKQKSFSGVLPGDAVLPVYSVYTRSGALDATDPNVIRGSSGYAKVSIYTLATSIFNKSR